MPLPLVYPANIFPSAFGRQRPYAGTGYCRSQTTSQDSTKLAACLYLPQIQAFIFQRTTEMFDHHVIHPVASAIHWDMCSDLPELLCKIAARKLRTLIRIEDFWYAVAFHCSPPGGHTEISIHGVRHAPREHRSAASP